jgi:hypothetical protein
VVDVGVRQDDGVQSGWVEWKRLPIPLAQGLQALELAAVDQDTPVIELDEILRACDGTGGTEKGQGRDTGTLAELCHAA